VQPNVMPPGVDKSCLSHREGVERILATAPFAEIYGFVLVSIEDDACKLRIPFRPVLEGPGGIIAAPVYMARAAGREHVVGD